MKEKLTYLFSFLLMAILVMMMFASFDYTNNDGWNNGYNAFANSDSSLLYQVSVDFLKHPASIFDWDFGTCFYFFPNLLVMLIATIIFTNPSVVVFAASIMHFFILIVLVNILFKKIFKNISKYTLILSNFTILLLIVNTIKNGDFCTLTSHLFLPLHSGAFINTIAALIFVFNYLDSKKRKHLIYLLLLSIIAIFSDMIFIIYFSLPLIVGLIAIILFKKDFRKKENLILGSYLIISVIIGYALHRIIIIANILSVMSIRRIPENALNSFHLMMHHFHLIITGSFLSFIIVSLTIISLLISSFIAFKIIFIKKLSFVNSSNNFLIYFVFVAFSFVLSFIAPIINGNYLGFDSIRYIIPPVYLALFNIALLIEFFVVSKRKIKYLSITTIAVLFVYSCFILLNVKDANPFGSISKIKNYYPAVVKATDEFSNQYHVKNGLGNYWDARFITNFSKQNVTVNLVRSDFHPMRYANNPHSYYYSAYPKVNSVVYNFIVLQYLEDTAIVYNVFDKNDIKKVIVDGYGFYLLPDFKIKDDFTGFELIKKPLNN